MRVLEAGDLEKEKVKVKERIFWFLTKNKVA